MLDNYLRKYFVMGSQNCTRPPEVILEEALKAGITAFQYREKGTNALDGEEKLILGKKLRELCHKYRVPFFVNDNLDFALQLEADGIHVGQDDQCVAEIRIKHPNMLIGLSISNHQEFNESYIELVDYIGVGPIYQTSSKEDAKAPVGTEWISELRKEHPYLPIVGIGGITTVNANNVIKAGTNGVAIISAITQADNIYEAVQQL